MQARCLHHLLGGGCAGLGASQRLAPRWVCGLAARELGEVMEVGVGGAEDEVILDGECGDPEVVGGNLSAFLAELEVEV